MARDLPPLSHLVAFEAAARLQSFTAAAKELDLTHGAVSRAVGALEAHLDSKLFTRRNRRVFLNARGQILKEATNQSFEALQRAVERIRSYAGGRSLVVAAEPELAAGLLMPLVAEHGDELLLDLVVMPKSGPVDLIADSCDLVLVSGQPGWSKEYNVVTLVAEQVGPLCHPAYWEQVGGLENATLLHNDLVGSEWFDWAKSVGRDVHPAADKTHPTGAICLREAAAGRGIAIGSLPHCLAHMTAGTLIAPFGLEEAGRDLIALTLDEPESEPKLATFVTWFTRFAGTDAERAAA